MVYLNLFRVGMLPLCCAAPVAGQEMLEAIQVWRRSRLGCDVQPGAAEPQLITTSFPHLSHRICLSSVENPSFWSHRAFPLFLDLSLVCDHPMFLLFWVVTLLVNHSIKLQPGLK